MPKNFPIAGFEADDHWRNRWNVNSNHRIKVELDDLGRVNFVKEDSHVSNVVLEAEAADLKRLHSGHGVRVRDNRAFSCHLNGLNSGDVRGKLVVHEYDAEGNLISRQSVSNGSRALFVARVETVALVLSIRLVGAGGFTIRDVEMTPVSAVANAEPGLHKYDGLMPSVSLPTLDNQVRRIQNEVKRLASATQQVAKLSSGVLDGTIGGPASPSSELKASKDSQRDMILDLAASLPQSNGSRYYSELIDLHVVIIADENMFNHYQGIFRKLSYATPSNIDELVSERFDLLLFVTTWKGRLSEDWRGVKHREVPASALEKLLDHARNASVPSVFQSKEDPSNFENFLPLAKKFDYIFTTDSDCIPRYMQEVGHERVFHAEYGVSPRLNNPVGSRNVTLNRAFFAGAYPARYVERVADMNMIFDSVLDSGGSLTIADRMATSEGYDYPDKYLGLTIDPIPHHLLQNVHKLFRFNLNFNSIKNSPTMCAIRVYELQANGKGLISDYAKSVLNLFPEVRMLPHKSDLRGLFEAGITEVDHRVNTAQVRNIMTDRTNFDVAARMLSQIGLASAVPAARARVAVVGDSSNQAVQDAFSRQSYQDAVLIDQDAVQTSGLSQVAANVGADFVTSFDGSINYERNHLQDSINAFKYVDVDFVTQSIDATGSSQLGIPHNYTRQVGALPLTLFSVDKLGGNSLKTVGTDAAQNLGYVLPFSGLSRRNSIELQSMSESDVMDPVLSIIVPVHNNGRFLETKCIPSIQRNKSAGRFEILLVDDGSNDLETLRICEELNAMPTVSYVSLGGTGSGSASLPRNVGIRESKAPLVTFLDPDNEISENGYDNLIEVYQEAKRVNNNVQFASGYQVKVGAKMGMTGKHTGERVRLVDEALADFFSKGLFPVVSTQAAVIEKDLAKNLEFVQGAAGQDTLFGWEMLIQSNAGVFTADAHLLYYAERGDSITNAIDSGYFHKRVIMEHAILEFLKKHSLLGVYTETHLPRFVRHWYLKKLELVVDGERPEAERLLNEILDMYGLRLSDFTS